MNPNPKLIDRINNKHIGKGIANRLCLYYPYLMSVNLHEDLSVGDKVRVTTGELSGVKPEKGKIDTRMVEVRAEGDGKTFVVFLRDLSPVVAEARDRW